MKIFVLIIGLFLAVEVQAQRFVRTVGTYADLRALPVTDPTATNAFVNGYSNSNDGGQGSWSWYPNDTTAADVGTILTSSSGGVGRWKRQYNGRAHLRWFGAKGDNTTDDTTAVQAWMDMSKKGKSLFADLGFYRVNSINGTSIRDNGTAPGTNGPVSGIDIEGERPPSYPWFGPGSVETNLVVFTGKEPGYPIFDFIGNWGVRMRNIEFTTAAGLTGTDRPLTAVLIGRNGTNSNGGNNSSFANIVTWGDYQIAGVTALQTELTRFDRCTFMVPGTAPQAGTYFSFLANTLYVPIVSKFMGLTNIQQGGQSVNVMNECVWYQYTSTANDSVSSVFELAGNLTINNPYCYIANSTNNFIFRYGTYGTTINAPQIEFGSRVPNMVHFKEGYPYSDFQINNGWAMTPIYAEANNCVLDGFVLNGGTFYGGATNNLNVSVLNNSMIHPTVSGGGRYWIRNAGTNNNFVNVIGTNIIGAAQTALQVTTSDGRFGLGIASPQTLIHLKSPSTATASQPLLRLGTAGVFGLNGPAIDFNIEDNAGTDTIVARSASRLTTGGAGAVSADWVLSTINLGTFADRVKVNVFGMLLTGTLNSTLGYQYNSSGTAGNYLRGNGTAFVDAQLNASDLAVGTVPTARLGSNVANSTNFLRGDQVWAPVTITSGTVTSVGQTVPTDEFIISGSPVTTSGTLAITKQLQTANFGWWGPVSGGAAVPLFRAMVAADIPVSSIVATTKLTATGTKDATTFLRGDDTWALPPGGGGVGTVTSVAQTVPAEFAIAGSPITTAGTLAITKATQSSNTFWAGPTSGAVAQPAFRAFVGNDIPNGLLIASTKLSATGTKDSTTFLRGDDTWAVPSGGGGGTFFADPTGLIGLSAVNGVSTNATRADGHAALSQAIVPTWTGLHTFLNSTTNQMRIGWDPTQSTWIYGDSGGQFNILPTGGEVNITGILDASGGFKVNNAATSGNILRGNGTAFISAAMSASDLSTGTVPIGRIGTSGTPGPTTFLSGDNTWKTAVTSVDLSVPTDIFTASGGPVTTIGTLNFSKVSQPANTAWMGPTNGAAAPPTFRTQVVSDLPNGTIFVVSTNIPHSNVTNVYSVFTVPTGKKWIMTGMDVAFTGGGGGADTFEMTVGTDSQVSNIVLTGIAFGHNSAPVGYYETAPLPADATARFVATATSVVKVYLMFASTVDSQFTVFLRGYYF